MNYYTDKWLTLVILGLVTEKLSVHTFTSWAQVPTGAGYVGAIQRGGLGGPCPRRFCLAPPDFFVVSLSSSFG